MTPAKPSAGEKALLQKTEADGGFNLVITDKWAVFFPKQCEAQIDFLIERIAALPVAGADDGVRPLAWRYELAHARFWPDDKTVGDYTDWRWHVSDTEPNAGEGMRNVTPLYASTPSGADEGVREALAKLKEAIAFADDNATLFEDDEKHAWASHAHHLRGVILALTSPSDDGVREALKRCEGNFKEVVRVKRNTDARFATALSGLQEIYDRSREDFIKEIAGQSFENATGSLASPPSVRLVERATALSLVDKIRSGSHDGWGYGRDECANFIIAIAEQPLTTVERENRCPKCGDLPTYQTPDGTYWDGNAHFWRVPAEQPRSEGSKP